MFGKPNHQMLSCFHTVWTGALVFIPAPEKLTLQDKGVVSFLSDKQIHCGKLES